MGVPKSEKASMNTKSEPAKIVGAIRGKVRVTAFLNGLHPRLSEASMREASTFLNAPLVNR